MILVAGHTIHPPSLSLTSPLPPAACGACSPNATEAFCPIKSKPPQPPAPGPPSSPTQALVLSSFIQTLLEHAIDKSTPWSTPGKHSAPWWNFQLSILRRRLSWAEQQGRRTPVPPGAFETFFSLRQEFKLAIRQAPFLFCVQKTRQNKSAATWKQLLQATKPTAKATLPDYGSDGSFLDKCHLLLEQFFPPNTDDLHELPTGVARPLSTSGPLSTR